MKSIFNFIRAHKIVSLIFVIVIVGAVLYFTKDPKEIKHDYIVIGRSEVVQEVDVTGRVVPISKVDLAILSGGRVDDIKVKVGDIVQAGDVLLSVDTSDLQVRLAKQLAQLEKVEYVLAKQEPKTEALDDLEKAYEDGFNMVANAFLDLPSIVNGIDSILSHRYISHNTIISSTRTTQNYRKIAVDDFNLAEEKYNDVLKKYKIASRYSERAVIDDLIIETYEATKLIADAVKSLKNLIDYVEDKRELGQTDLEMIDVDQEILEEYTDETNLHLVNLLQTKDTISDSKIGMTDEVYDVDSMRLDVKQAKLDIEETYVEIQNRSIKSPIDGVVTEVSAKVGEIVSSGARAVSLISTVEFRLEVNLSESDISKVKIGANADVVLDAYENDLIFKAKVLSIDPAETMVEGVATYKTTLEFLEQDDRIKSGMTADISIKGETREDVISVPLRSLVTKNGSRYIQVLENNEIVERPVSIGLRGTDGNVEILEGLSVGEKVIVYMDRN